MSLSPCFDIKAVLYFRVHDSIMYGGPGTVGYATQSFQLGPNSQLQNFNDALAEEAKARIAWMCSVPPEKLDFLTADEYERETEEDNDDA